MIVPRAFRYGSQPEMAQPPHSEKLVKVKKAANGDVGAARGLSPKGKTPLKIGTVPPATPSKPVIIPTRTETPRTRSNIGSKASSSSKHDHKSNPPSILVQRPSVSSLLAATSIPTGRNASFNQFEAASRRKNPQWESLGEAVSYDRRNPFSSSSPRSWDLLQSPPTSSEVHGYSLSSDGTTTPTTSSRSLSASSLPSLECDPSSPLTSSNPSTPGISINRRSRRQRSLSSELCENGDHPLSQTNSYVKGSQAPHVGDIDILMADVTMPTVPPRSSFKSNLTASFRGIKSAAKSFSNFALPVFQQDESFNRSILSVPLQFTDERRPSMLDEAPDVSLRRYLNPVHISASELCHHPNQRHLRRDRCTASIQLQTYHRKVRPLKNASSPPIFISSDRTNPDHDLVIDDASTPRQREPRENSDFLRVIVLELNMRKAGKLADASPGRAKIWLPPRQSAKAQEIDLGGVPRRWSSVVP